MMPESTDYLWVALVTTLLLTCLPVIFRVYVYRTHMEQLHLQNLTIDNITHLLHTAPILFGGNWR